MSETPEAGVEPVAAEAGATAGAAASETRKAAGEAAAKASRKATEFASDAARTVEQGAHKAARGFEVAAGFGQANFDAIVESSRAAARAAETINAELLAFSKKAYEDAVAAAQELGGVKSVSEYVERQTAFGRRMMDALVAETVKMNEIYADAARSCLEPVSARVQESVERMRGHRA